jgi:outer membrane protein assembly factor BamB
MLGNAVQAAPSGIFTAFGGAFDYILVGTRNSSGGNLFYALKVSTGDVVGTPVNGGSATAIGIISSAAAVDYTNKRVYFASRAGTSSNTLWCLDITAAGVSFAWAKALGDIDGGPVLRGGRVYVGDNTGTVWGVDAVDGNNPWSYGTGDGAVKGFVFPDRFSSKLYLSTVNNVWGLADGASTPVWPAVSLPAPSIPLFANGSPYLYVGGSDGRLYQLDMTLADGATPPTVRSVPLGDALAGAGPPSFDVPNALIYVGSEGGVIYAVQYPLP